MMPISSFLTPGSKAATSGGSSWGRSETRFSSGGGGCSQKPPVFCRVYQGLLGSCSQVVERILAGGIMIPGVEMLSASSSSTATEIG